MLDLAFYSADKFLSAAHYGTGGGEDAAGDAGEELQYGIARLPGCTTTFSSSSLSQSFRVYSGLQFTLLVGSGAHGRVAYHFDEDRLRGLSQHTGASVIHFLMCSISVCVCGLHLCIPYRLFLPFFFFFLF
jgi:hypothetical protein